jgi:hypothetical protein
MAIFHLAGVQLSEAATSLAPQFQIGRYKVPQDVAEECMG